VVNRDADGNTTITERVLIGEELGAARVGLSNSRGSGFAVLCRPAQVDGPLPKARRGAS